MLRLERLRFLRPLTPRCMDVTATGLPWRVARPAWLRQSRRDLTATMKSLVVNIDDFYDALDSVTCQPLRNLSFAGGSKRQNQKANEESTNHSREAARTFD